MHGTFYQEKICYHVKVLSTKNYYCHVGVGRKNNKHIEIWLAIHLGGRVLESY
jgi:hypothetical protein